MRVKIKDVHNAHGRTFKLVLEPENDSDEESYRFLRSLIQTSGEQGKTALCSYKAECEDNRISISLAEQVKEIAKVDHLWNPYREDQKFVVLRVEGDEKNHQWTSDAPCPHFECHWCHKETWGVNRRAIEVYDLGLRRMELVHVHDECQKKREKQIASISFAETVE